MSFIILVFLSIKISFCFIKDFDGLTFYSSATLSKGSYLLMTNKGILMYDETFTELISKYDISFNSNYYENLINKYSSEEDEKILISANKNIYFFSSKGELINNCILNEQYVNPIKSCIMIIPFEILEDSYSFYYIYNYLNKINFQKYQIDLTSLNHNDYCSRISYNYYTLNNLCGNHDNYISCQLINYKHSPSFICFTTSHLTDSTIYMKIYDIKNNFAETGSKTFGSSSYEIITGKIDNGNDQIIFMITTNFNYYVFTIYEDNFNFESSSIGSISGCSYHKNINITYFNETEELIISFTGTCSSKIYIFLYSYKKNTKLTFFGAIRPFTLGDTNICCNFKDNIFSKINYSIQFSPLTNRYLITIGTLGTTNNYISIFVLDKDIEIINQPIELELFSLPLFICEDYDNYTNYNCGDLKNELDNNYLKFIPKCSIYTNEIKNTCQISNFNYKIFNISYRLKKCDIISCIKKKCSPIYYNLLENNTSINELIDIIKNGSINKYLDDILYGSKRDIILTDINSNIYQISSTQNLRNHSTNLTTIDFSECEKILKDHYNIDENETLLMLKIEKTPENPKSLISEVEYLPFHPKNKSVLNLDLCKDAKILLYNNLRSPIDVDNFYKYNTSSDYYNDLCFTNNSEDGVDMTVSERRKSYANNDINICEIGCELVGYDKLTNKSQCQCNIKQEISIRNIKKNVAEIYKSFMGKTSSNFEIIKCYFLLFFKNNIIKNFGSYILLFIILIYIILMILFIIKGYRSLKKDIKYLYLSLKDDKNYQSKRYSINLGTTSIVENKTINKNKSKRYSINLGKTSKVDKNKSKRYSVNLGINSFVNNKKINKNIKSENINKHNPIKKNRKDDKRIIINNNSILKYNNDNNDLSNSNRIFNVDKNKNRNSITKESKMKKSKNKNENNNQKIKDKAKDLDNFDKSKKLNSEKKFLDFEINKLQYKEALKYDKRNFFQYYLSLLRNGHILFFSFVPNKDFNSMHIKICLFMISFANYFTVNALFFSDSTMHKIYTNKGQYNFIYQLPKIFYSSLICSVINTLLKFLSLTQQDIMKLKALKKGEDIKKKLKRLRKIIIIKFILFFILSFIFLILFWFFVSSFCAVYKNTQIFLINDTLISFGFSLIYPLGYYLLSGIFRIISLKSKEKNKAFLYRISLFISYM